MSWSLTLHPCPRRAASIPNCASNRSPTFSTRSSCAMPHSRYIAPNIRPDVPSAELEVKTDRRTQHQRTYAPPHTSIGLHASQQISPSFQRLPSARHQQPFLAHHDLHPDATASVVAPTWSVRCTSILALRTSIYHMPALAIASISPLRTLRPQPTQAPSGHN